MSDPTFMADPTRLVIAAIAGIMVLWGCERLAPGEAK